MLSFRSPRFPPIPFLMASKSKILFIGGTEKFIVYASAKASHRTYFLVRETTLSNPAKSKVLENFKDLGFNFVMGDLYEHESLVKAIEQVYVVIGEGTRSRLIKPHIL